MEHLKDYCIRGGIKATPEKVAWLEQDLRLLLERYNGEIAITEVKE